MNRTPIVLAALVACAAPAAAATQQIHVFLHSEPLHIAPEAMSGAVGDVLELTVENPVEGTGPHDLVVDGYGVRTPLLDPGNSVPVTVALDKAGTYEYYCSVPGHKEGGMVGTLVVRGGDAGPAGENGSPTTALVGAIVALALTALWVRRK